MKWTPERTNRLVQLRNSGCSHTEIAVAMGISKKQVSAKIFYIDNNCKAKRKPSRSENSSPAINYATCVLEPIQRARELFGNSFKQKFGICFLNGNRILAGGELKEAMDAEEAKREGI